MLVAALIVIGRPPGVIVTLGPPRQVVTINPKIGVHTRLTDEVEEWKIKRTLEMVREMGASWIVEFFPWPYHEVEPGRFNWQHADLVVDHARAQGLTVIARLGWVPSWARPPAEEQQTTFTYLDAAHYQDFGNYVYAFVTHFRGRIKHIIIWNEPNLSFEWGFRPVNPVEYTELLRVAYTRAKEADPTVMVLGGALAPTLAPSGHPEGMNDLDYLEGMYQAGAEQWFDALAAHTYGWKFPLDDPPDPDTINFRRVELLREIMVRHGDAHKPIFITEGGWNDHPRWTKAVRPAQRIAYTIGAYELARREWDWCAAVCMWAFRFPWPNYDYRDYFAFVTVDFTPRPIYLEVRRYARGW